MSAKTDRLIREAIECRVIATTKTNMSQAADWRDRSVAAEVELKEEIARLEAAQAQETVDGKGRTWHVMVREGGSVSVYYTRPAANCVFVVWDSLDHERLPAA